MLALHKKHIAWLEEHKKKGKPVPQALAAYVDKSVPNLSTKIVLVELDGKRMLLTGDATEDKILEGLELAGLLGRGDKSKLEIDLLKVPHIAVPITSKSTSSSASSRSIMYFPVTVNTAIPNVTR